MHHSLDRFFGGWGGRIPSWGLRIIRARRKWDCWDGQDWDDDWSLSHADTAAMRHVLRTTQAPVLFSHSGVRAVFDHPRNVPDDVLELVRDSEGLIMVGFNSCYLVPSCSTNKATAKDVVRHNCSYSQSSGSWSCRSRSRFRRSRSGSSRPWGCTKIKIYSELLFNAPTDEDLAKLSSKNFLKVFQNVELVRDRIWCIEQKLQMKRRYRKQRRADVTEICNQK